MADKQKVTEEMLQKLLNTPIDESGQATPEQAKFIMQVHEERKK